MQRVSPPSRRNRFSISLVVNLFCLAFILVFFLLLCLFSSVLSALAKDATFSFSYFGGKYKLPSRYYFNMFKREERDADLTPDFTRISCRRRLFPSCCLRFLLACDCRRILGDTKWWLVVAFLHSRQVKRIPKDPINEFII